MTRSADFSHTVKNGVRAAQAHLVVHGNRVGAGSQTPLVGFIVAKSVGGAVVRHRVSRRLRHAARGVLAELDPADRVVVRALPGSCAADSTRLSAELRAAVGRVTDLLEKRT